MREWFGAVMVVLGFGGVIWGFGRVGCSVRVMVVVVGHVAEILGHEGMKCNNFILKISMTWSLEFLRK